MRRTVLKTALVVLAVSSGAGAAPFTWVGAGATRSWTDGANWTGGSPPPDDGTASVTVAAAGSISLDGTRVVSALSISAAGTVTLQAGSQPASILVVRGGTLSRSARGSLVSQVPLFDGGALSLTGFENQTALGTGTLFNLRATGTPGPVSVSQAILVASGDAAPPASLLSLGSGAWLDLAGRSLAVGSLAGAGSVTNTSFTHATLLVGGDGTDSLFSGVLGGQLSDQSNGNGLDFVKLGTGTLTFSGASAIGGWARVADGNLVVTGTLTNGNPGFDYVVVSSSSSQHGRLWGTGNVGTIYTAGNSVPGGVVNPGLPASRGILHAASADLRRGTLAIRVAGYGTAGVDYDQLDATSGSLDFDNESELDIDLGGLSSAGGPITIARYASGNGPPALQPQQIRVLNNPANLVAQVASGASALTLTMKTPTPTSAPLFVATPAHGLVTSESGRSASFTVALGRAPASTVTVPVASSDSGEGLVSPTSLTFTPANYSTPQTVTVTGVDDAVPDGNTSYAITIGPAVSSDSTYSDKSAPSVSVINLDDDLITVSPSSGLVSAPAGQPTASFTLTFHAAPSQQLWMPLSTSDPRLGAPAPALLNVFPFGGTPAPITIAVNGVHSLQAACVPYAIQALAVVSVDPVFGGFELPDVSVCNQGDRAPTAAGETLAVPNGGVLSISAPGVLANDSDPDGDPLSAELVEPPAHGALQLFADGSFTYTPAAGFVGTDSFLYRASDGALWSAPVAVTLNTTSNAPVAAADSYSWQNGDQALVVAAPGVLANDSDFQAGPLTAVLVSGPSHGSLDLRADGSFTYLPDAGFGGADSFSYVASDGRSSSPAVVTIDVSLPALYEAGGLTLSVDGTRSPGGPVTITAHVANTGTMALLGARLAISLSGISLGRASSTGVDLVWDGSSLPVADLPLGTAVDFVLTGEIVAEPGARATVSATFENASGRPLAAVQEASVEVGRIQLDAGGCGCRGTNGGAGLAWVALGGALLLRRRRSVLPGRRHLHLRPRLVEDHVRLGGLAAAERVDRHHGNALAAVVQPHVDAELAGRTHLDRLPLDVDAASRDDSAGHGNRRAIRLVAGPLHGEQDLAQGLRRLLETVRVHARRLSFAHLDAPVAGRNLDFAAGRGDHRGAPLGGDDETTAFAARDGASVLDLKRHAALSPLDVRFDTAAHASPQEARAGGRQPDLAAVAELDADAVHRQLGLAVAGGADRIARSDAVAGGGRRPRTGAALQLDDAALVHQHRSGSRGAGVDTGGLGARSGWGWGGRGRALLAPAPLQGDEQRERKATRVHQGTYTSRDPAAATFARRGPCGSR